MKILAYLVLIASSCICLHSATNPPKSHAQQDFEDQCQQLMGQFSAVEDFLSIYQPVNMMFVVSQVPLTITEPGKYTVVQDLVYTGAGPAITIAADNVCINFVNHNLSLNNINAVGILASGINELVLENDVILGTYSVGVHLQNVSACNIHNLYIGSNLLGNSQEMLIENCQNVQISDSQFAGHAPVSVNASSHVTVDSCTFNGAADAYGLQILGASDNVIVKKSTFSNCLSALYVASVDGMLVDHCQATASNAVNGNLVQLGAADSFANDVIIRNSSFIQTQAVEGFDGILLAAGTNCLLENILVDTCGLDSAGGDATSAIHIGFQENDAFQDFLAKNCIVKGANQRAVFIEHGQKIVFDECQISEALQYNIQMTNAASCTVKNSMIFDGNCGVYINNSVSGGKNSIKDCFVYNNATVGINVADMAKNSVLGNMVWANDIGIQIAFSDYTETFFNACCNNTQTNCSNVFPSQAPDDMAYAVAGTNLCP